MPVSPEPVSPEPLTLDVAIERLNSMVLADPHAMQRLCEHRTLCNAALTEHPTAQVVAQRGDQFVGEHNIIGMLGVINGIFGVDADGWGFIAAKYEDTGELLEFIRTPARK
jgi:hypothetical protein